MDEHGRALAEAVERALPGWVERCVLRCLAAAGRLPEPAVMAATVEAGRNATAEVGAEVRALVAADIDEQATTPLSIVRGAVQYPTAVLREAGVPPVVRDRIQERLFPEDVYDLTPATFAEVDPALAEPGLVWGAAKAHAHIQRHGRPSE